MSVFAAGTSRRRSRLLMFSVAALAVLGGGLYWLEQKTARLSLFARGSLARAEKAIKEGDLKEAERQLVAAAGDTEKRFGQKSLNMLFVVDRVAKFYHDIGRLGDAETNYKRALQILVNLGYGQTNVGVITTSLSVADVYLDRGDLDKAMVGYSWCLEKAREVGKGEDAASPLPEHGNREELVDLCVDRQARLLLRMGKHAQAVDTYRPVLERSRQQVQQASGDARAEAEAKHAHLLNTMAVLCDGAGMFEEGLSHVKAALTLCEGGRQPELLASALFNQGCLQFHMANDLEGAERTLVAAREAAETSKDSHQVAAVDRVLGDLRAKLGGAQRAS